MFERRPLQATVSGNMLVSGQEVSEVEGSAGLARGEGEEWLICSEEEEEEEESLSLQRLRQAGDSELDDIVLEDDQEDDFTSSMLAALDCWHRRFQNCPSTSVTVRLSAASLVVFVIEPSYANSITRHI